MIGIKRNTLYRSLIYYNSNINTTPLTISLTIAPNANADAHKYSIKYIVNYFNNHLKYQRKSATLAMSNTVKTNAAIRSIKIASPAIPNINSLIIVFKLHELYIRSDVPLTPRTLRLCSIVRSRVQGPRCCYHQSCRPQRPAEYLLP